MTSLPAAPAGGVEAPGTGALLATGCGTAVASVCAVGLLAMERLVGGPWAALAVLLGGLLCAGLARALARQLQVLPSGAGLLAFLARGLSRRAALLLFVPYLLLTLLLMGAEATVVGLLLARALALPVLLSALGFLVGTWALCRAGLRLGLRAQAFATWALMAGLLLCAGHALLTAPRGAWQVTPPPPLRMLAAVGQATFLFMGFELMVSFAPLGPRRLGAALSGSVGLLCGFYAVLALGFAVLPAGLEASAVPQLALAERAGGGVVLGLVTVLSLLASFSSFNGALLSLSRLLAALAQQGLLPRAVVALHPRTQVPRRALRDLLLIACAAALLVQLLGLLLPVLLGAAVAAALVYGGLLWARERAPFCEAARPRWRRGLGALLGAAYVGLGVGVVVDAGALRPILLLLLGGAYGVGGLAARRAGGPRGR